MAQVCTHAEDLADSTPPSVNDPAIIVFMMSCTSSQDMSQKLDLCSWGKGRFFLGILEQVD